LPQQRLTEDFLLAASFHRAATMLLQLCKLYLRWPSSWSRRSALPRNVSWLSGAAVF
jgi:hypothetical protein